MLNNLKNYINDKDFRMHIYYKKINIVNYVDILSLESSRISVKSNDGIIVIKGDNLTVSKLLENELLILGNISNIEFNV